MKKNLVYVLLFVIGILIGAIITFLFKQKTEIQSPSFAIRDTSNIAFPPTGQPVTQAQAQNMHDSYMRNSGKIIFNYHDPSTGALVTNQPLEGLSFDTAAVGPVMRAGGDKIYIMLGVVNRALGSSSTKDDLFTTILLSTKKGAKASDPDIFVNANGADYSDPCPPYCPQH